MSEELLVGFAVSNGDEMCSSVIFELAVKTFQEKNPGKIITPEMVGYATSLDRFVNIKDAKKIALASGQAVYEAHDELKIVKTYDSSSLNYVGGFGTLLKPIVMKCPCCSYYQYYMGEVIYRDGVYHLANTVVSVLHEIKDEVSFSCSTCGTVFRDTFYQTKCQTCEHIILVSSNFDDSSYCPVCKEYAFAKELNRKYEEKEEEKRKRIEIEDRFGKIASLLLLTVITIVIFYQTVVSNYGADHGFGK